MRILIVSATENEIAPIKKELKFNMTGACTLKYTAIKNFDVDFLVTGIGSVLTTYYLLKKLAVKKYDIVINAGIAGSFNELLDIGEVVHVHEEQFADLGIEENNDFKNLFEKGFMKTNDNPFTNGKLINNTETQIAELVKNVSAITVNRTHGNKESIKLFKNKYNADIETMEGAAVFYVCLMEKIKFIQIRAVSNYVKERDIADWNIPLAIKSLNNKLSEIITVLKKES